MKSYSNELMDTIEKSMAPHRYKILDDEIMSQITGRIEENLKMIDGFQPKKTLSLARWIDRAQSSLWFFIFVCIFFFAAKLTIESYLHKGMYP